MFFDSEYFVEGFLHRVLAAASSVEASIEIEFFVECATTWLKPSSALPLLPLVRWISSLAFSLVEHLAAASLPDLEEEHFSDCS